MKSKSSFTFLLFRNLKGILFYFSLFKNDSVLCQDLLEIPYNKDTFSLELNFRNSNSLVIIVAGSGPTDKNGNGPSYRNNCLKMLSDSLANYNISTLRFDKRGIGKSLFKSLKEEDVTIDTFVNDVLFIKSYIKKKYSFKNIYILGHSEGSLIGVLASRLDSSIRGFISIAGAAYSADSIIRHQFLNQTVSVQTKVNEYLFILKSGNFIYNIDKDFYALFRPSIQPYFISWLKYVPHIEISHLKIPVLIIHGSEDLQVDSANAKLLNSFGLQSKLVIIKGMNHVLKKVNSKLENIGSYNDENYPIHEDLAKEVNTFLKNVVVK